MCEHSKKGFGDPLAFQDKGGMKVNSLSFIKIYILKSITQKYFYLKMGFVVSHDFKNKKMCFWTNTLTDHSHVCELRSKQSRFERQEMYNATAYCIIQQLLNATKNSWPEFYLKNNPYYFSCKMGILTFQLLPIY